MIPKIASTQKIRCGLYARCSTVHQDLELQLTDLRRYAAARDFEVIGEFTDLGVSGGRERRPGLDELMDHARKRRLDAVLVWRFDRFARSVKHLVLALEEFRGLGIDFVSFQENIDSSTPMGAAMFAIIGAMAQLERDCIRARVNAGLRRCRERGIQLGRPKAPEAVRDEVQRLREQGLSFPEIARRSGVSTSTAYRLSKIPR